MKAIALIAALLAGASCCLSAVLAVEIRGLRDRVGVLEERTRFLTPTGADLSWTSTVPGQAIGPGVPCFTTLGGTGSMTCAVWSGSYFTVPNNDINQGREIK